MHKTLAIALLAALPLLAACGERDAPQPSGSSAKPADSMIGRRVQQAMDKAREKLATENIDLDKLHVSGDGSGINISTRDADDGRPKAEITPQGDLLIAGRKVEADAEQHALLVQYRRQVEGIASAGMDIGAAGAELGVKAATEALKGVFSGNTDQIDQHVEAEAEKIKASAMKLCDQLPAMLDTQTRLAAAMPEFRPYATLEQSDIDDCHDDKDVADVHREMRAEVQREVRENVRQGIREGIRGGIQAAAQATGLASSGTADESDADPSTNAAAEAEAASVDADSR